MDVPFHRVKVCGPVLVAARGASIHTFRVADGSYIATWSLPEQPGSQGSQGSQGPRKAPAVSIPETTAVTEPSDTPPSKRRKVESAGDKEQQPAAAEARGPRKKRAPAAAVMASLRSGDLPVVSILEVTADGRHVVVVMGHDKTVRVLAHDGEGHLTPISQRMVPKRPSAVVVTADGQTILCGDKFGDVYALPLVEVAKEVTEAKAEAKAEVEAKAAQTPLELRANSFTVHTKGNLQALEQQRRQKEQQTQQQRKQAPEDDGSCSLLLGHVSMLTAVAVAEAGPSRPLILTADRDEHIRVTRGVLGASPPQTAQTHIIETFCLGHTAFVSRLCVAAGRPDRLVSGGGDGVLRVWNFWPDGQTVGTLALEPLVEAVGVAAVAAAPDESMQKKGLLAVSGLFSFGEAESVFVVVCERVPALFFLTLQADGNTLAHTQTLRLPGLPLDVAVARETDGPRLLVAVAAEDDSSTTASLLAVTRPDQQSAWTVAEGAWGVLPADVGAQDTSVDPTALRQQLLFGTESLRKTGEEGTE